MNAVSKLRAPINKPANKIYGRAEVSPLEVVT